MSARRPVRRLQRRIGFQPFPASRPTCTPRPQPPAGPAASLPPDASPWSLTLPSCLPYPVTMLGSHADPRRSPWLKALPTMSGSTPTACGRGRGCLWRCPSAGRRGYEGFVSRVLSVGTSGIRMPACHRPSHRRLQPLSGRRHGLPRPERGAVHRGQPAAGVPGGRPGLLKCWISP